MPNYVLYTFYINGSNPPSLWLAAGDVMTKCRLRNLPDYFPTSPMLCHTHLMFAPMDIIFGRPRLLRRVWLYLCVLALWVCAGCENNEPPPDNARSHIYIADSGNNRIVRMDDMDGKGWTTLSGNSGAKATPFDAPTGVYVDSNGHIFVADSGNYRIVRTDGMNGDEWIAVGTEGKGKGQFKSPYSVFTDRESRIYVTDTSNCRICRMDNIDVSNWATLGSRGTGASHFCAPMGLFVDANEKIYVSDGIDVVNNLLNSRVVEMDDMDSSGWRQYGKGIGAGKGEFNKPCGICIDSNGKFYIADTYNNRIICMDLIEGKNWTVLGGTEGAGVNEFNNPCGIWVDPAGHIFVSDTGNDRIVRMDDMKGKNWVTYGTTGSSAGTFRTPVGIMVR